MASLSSRLWQGKKEDSYFVDDTCADELLAIPLGAPPGCSLHRRAAFRDFSVFRGDDTYFVTTADVVTIFSIAELGAGVWTGNWFIGLGTHSEQSLPVARRLTPAWGDSLQVLPRCRCPMCRRAHCRASF